MRVEKTLQSFEFQISNQVPLETAFTVEMIGMGMGLLFQFGSDFRLCVLFVSSVWVGQTVVKMLMLYNMWALWTHTKTDPHGLYKQALQLGLMGVDVNRICIQPNNRLFFYQLRLIRFNPI